MATEAVNDLGRLRFRLGISFAALAAVLLWVPSLWAQGLAGLLSSKQSAPASAQTDPLKRDTPRDAIYALLEACHDYRLPVAAEYLDLSKIPKKQQAAQGPQLAKELCQLLDRNPQFEVDHLSNAPEGNLADNLSPNLEALATFEAKEGPVTLQMQRANQIWRVSADSVVQIAGLSAMAQESPIEKHLPEPLVAITFVGTPLWIWLVLILTAVLLSLLSKFLSHRFIAITKQISRRYAANLHTYRLEGLVEPIRLLLSVMVFSACVEAIAPSALLRDYLFKLLTLLFFMGAASLAMRIVDIVSDRMISRLDPRQRALSYSVLPLGVRVTKVCILGLAVLFTLGFWGYSTDKILAGLGLGGLAVALAAQKTIENLFGGVSVITDRPVLVGDFCQFGGQTGTVEDIGLRSTRVCTLDRTVVSIPNSTFSTMTLENFSRRDRFWFHPTLNLRRDTTPEQIKSMMDAVTKMLQEHPKVDAAGVPLRFTKITPNSFDLEIFAYILTADGNEFLQLQSELLLKMLQTASELNIGFAVPFSESMAVVRRIDPGGDSDEAAKAALAGVGPGRDAEK